MPFASAAKLFDNLDLLQSQSRCPAAVSIALRSLLDRTELAAILTLLVATITLGA